jgi:hypothetical protein
MAAGKREQRVVPDEDARPGESFLQRFNRRKQDARQRQAAGPDAVESGTEAPPQELTDADMPPLEELDAESDYSVFLSAKVSEGLRRAALRKLFHSGRFNVIDELDDYAEDFTSFTALGDLVTSDMRHRIEVEARKAAESLVREQGADEEGEPAHVAAADARTSAEGPVIADVDPDPDQTETQPRVPEDV